MRLGTDKPGGLTKGKVCTVDHLFVVGLCFKTTSKSFWRVAVPPKQLKQD